MSGQRGEEEKSGLGCACIEIGINLEVTERSHREKSQRRECKKLSQPAKSLRAHLFIEESLQAPKASEEAASSDPFLSKKKIKIQNFIVSKICVEESRTPSTIRWLLIWKRERLYTEECSVSITQWVLLGEYYILCTTYDAAYTLDTMEEHTARRAARQATFEFFFARSLWTLHMPKSSSSSLQAPEVKYNVLVRFWRSSKCFCWRMSGRIERKMQRRMVGRMPETAGSRLATHWRIQFGEEKSKFIRRERISRCELARLSLLLQSPVHLPRRSVSQWQAFSLRAAASAINAVACKAILSLSLSLHSKQRINSGKPPSGSRPFPGRPVNGWAVEPREPSEVFLGMKSVKRGNFFWVLLQRNCFQNMAISHEESLIRPIEWYDS